MTIGLISDTHGLLRDEASSALQGSELIIHAGDVGKPEILEKLRTIAPVVVVRGNIDVAPWAAQLPETAVAHAGAARFYVIHDVHDLKLDPAAEGYQAVVSGHSHKAGHSWRSGVLYINPGSAEYAVDPSATLRLRACGFCALLLENRIPRSTPRLIAI